MLGAIIDGASHYAVAIAALIGASTVIWRAWVKPARDRLMRTIESVEKMADLVSTEFETNGGSTIKDAVIATLEWQRMHDVQHAARPAARASRAAVNKAIAAQIPVDQRQRRPQRG